MNEKSVMTYKIMNEKHRDLHFVGPMIEYVLRTATL